MVNAPRWRAERDGQRARLVHRLRAARHRAAARPAHVSGACQRPPLQRQETRFRQRKPHLMRDFPYFPSALIPSVTSWICHDTSSVGRATLARKLDDPLFQSVRSERIAVDETRDEATAGVGLDARQLEIVRARGLVTRGRGRLWELQAARCGLGLSQWSCSHHFAARDRYSKKVSEMPSTAAPG